MVTADFLIIGAGVIGCAIAKEIQELFPDKCVVVVEKNKASGLETSQFNSGVIHSGIHLKPEFLKAKMAREGGDYVIRHCQMFNVPHKKIGMYILVPKSGFMELTGQVPSFLSLLKRARKQNIKIQLLTDSGVKRREKYLNSLFGLFLEKVYVIDPLHFVRSLQSVAEGNGVEFVFDQEVMEIKEASSSWVATTSSGTIKTACVINAAGLNAESISKKAGFLTPTVYYYRGEYYEVISDKKELINSLVYPVTKPGSPGLGIHLTKTISGKLILGPNAGKLMGHKDENHTDPAIFWGAVKPFFPEIELDDLRWSFSGVRTKLSDGVKESDFYIKSENSNIPWINLIGIESPGLTSSIAISKYVVKILNLL